MNAPRESFDGPATPYRDAIDVLIRQLAEELATQTRARLATTSVTERAAFSLGECAAKLGVSKRSVQNLIDRGELRARSVGTRILVPATALAAFLDGEEAAR